MKVKVVMDIQNCQIAETLDFDDDKFAPLTEDERRAAIEINIQEWANRQIQIVWEVVDEENTADD